MKVRKQKQNSSRFKINELSCMQTHAATVTGIDDVTPRLHSPGANIRSQMENFF